MKTMENDMLIKAVKRETKAENLTLEGIKMIELRDNLVKEIDILRLNIRESN